MLHSALKKKQQRNNLKALEKPLNIIETKIESAALQKMLFEDKKEAEKNLMTNMMWLFAKFKDVWF